MVARQPGETTGRASSSQARSRINSELGVFVIQVLIV